MKAWVSKATGEVERIFMEGEPTPEFSAETHTLIDVPEEFSHATHVWDAEAGAFVARPPAVPSVVTPLQMRRAIRVSGLKATLDAFAETQSEEVIEAWEYALQIERNNEMIEAARIALGWTVEQADDLFRLAATQ